MINDSRAVSAAGAGRMAGLMLALLAAACTPGALRSRHAGRPAAPYGHSRLISTVSWDFSAVIPQRKALGSDLWPCAWAIDGDLYCAWGDGGGFDGNDDNIGRASLGFARVSGSPSTDPASVRGTNIWGSPPYAQFPADFGGKVGSMIAVKGVLYANGGFWTAPNIKDPVHASGRGPVSSIAWSNDGAQSWQIASWSSPEPQGSFLDAGQDSASGSPTYIYLYYLRDGDDRHLFLKRTAPEFLTADPAAARRTEYFTDASRRSHAAHWSVREADAKPVFADANHVEGPSVVYDAAIGRYLLSAGHYASGDDNDSSAGQVGLFEAPNPWGPWATIGYYEDWGGFKAETTGDFLSLRIPSKWLSPDGKTLWAVFSGLKSLDSFNLVKGVLSLR